MLSSDESRAVLANIEYLCDRVGGVWLDDELAAVRDTRASDRSGGRRRAPRHHPLALQLDQVPSQVAEGDQLDVTPALADLSRLAVSVRRLDKVGATRLDERLLRLQGDYDLFESMSFELNVAADFVRDGHSVEFVPESTHGERTPEFVVDGSVEVECKKKFTRTRRDRRNDDAGISSADESGKGTQLLVPVSASTSRRIPIPLALMSTGRCNKSAHSRSLTSRLGPSLTTAGSCISRA